MLKLMQTEMTLGEKLEILSDAAKSDVSFTSGGTERKGDGEGMGNCRKAGIPCGKSSVTPIFNSLPISRDSTVVRSI